MCEQSQADGLVFKMYAHEDQANLWPPLSSDPGLLLPEIDAIYPALLTDPSVLRCPQDSREGKEVDPFRDSSYFYLGYAVRDEAEGRAFVEAYREALASGLDYSEALPIPPGHDDGDFKALHRLQLSKEEGADIPVMFDRSLDHHRPPGITVLYMDGHVEFIRERDNRFPAVRWFLEELQSFQP